jgi:hypothetical protein
VQGIMFVELSRFVDARFGKETWSRLLTGLGLGDREYSPSNPYPDEEFDLLVEGLADAQGRDPQEVLERFGAFLAPELLGGLYGMLIDPRWRLLDVLEHTESTIHTVIRARDPAADPPHLVVERPSPSEVVILYGSPRRLCAVAKGIIRGAAERYGEAVDVTEMTCMLRGDARCEIVVHRRET